MVEPGSKCGGRSRGPCADRTRGAEVSQSISGRLAGLVDILYLRVCQWPGMELIAGHV